MLLALPLLMLLGLAVLNLLAFLITDGIYSITRHKPEARKLEKKADRVFALSVIFLILLMGNWVWIIIEVVQKGL